MEDIKLDMSFCFIGRICSGKSTFAKYFAETHNLPIAPFGPYVFDYCKKNSLSTLRKNLQYIGQQFVKNDPDRFLKNVMHFTYTESDIIIFDGVRHNVIYDIIKKISKKSFYIYIDADCQVRFQRYCLRNEKISFEEFEILDNGETETEIESLRSSCELIIDSTKDLEENKILLNEFLNISGFGTS